MAELYGAQYSPIAYEKLVVDQVLKLVSEHRAFGICEDGETLTSPSSYLSQSMRLERVTTYVGKESIHAG